MWCGMWKVLAVRYPADQILTNLIALLPFFFLTSSHLLDRKRLNCNVSLSVDCQQFHASQYYYLPDTQRNNTMEQHIHATKK